MILFMFRVYVNYSYGNFGESHFISLLTLEIYPLTADYSLVNNNIVLIYSKQKARLFRFESPIDTYIECNIKSKGWRLQDTSQAFGRSRGYSRHIPLTLSRFHLGFLKIL